MPIADVERKTNPQLRELIIELRRVGATTPAPLYRDLAARLSASNRQWAQVNVGKVSDVVQEGEIGLVPGKVLSSGEPKQGLKVAAVNFSAFARQKIEKAGGQCLSIQQLVQQAPQGKGVRIVG